MKKLVLTFLALNFFIACTSSQNNMGQNSSEGILLYEISGNGLSEASYIFGTLHFVPSNLFAIPDILTEKIACTEALVIETNIDIPLKEQVRIAQRMILPSSQTLKDYLPEDVYNESMKFMIDSIGLSQKKAERYTHLKPVYLMGPLLMEYYNGVESYEKEFVKTAKKNEKEILFLEELEFQLDLLDSISIEDQVEDFSVEDLINEYKQMLKFYLDEDFDKLETLILEDKDYLKYEEMIMNIRNQKWVPQLMEMMAGRPLFAAVGAGHFFGEKGLVSLLEKEGYTVKQVQAELLTVE